MLCTWEMGLKFTRFDPVFVWGRKTRFRQDYWWVISLKNFVWQNKDIRKLFASVQSFPKTVATRKQTKHLNWTIHSSCCHSQSGELMGFPFLCATDTLDPKFFFESQHTVCFVRNGFELDLLWPKNWRWNRRGNWAVQMPGSAQHLDCAHQIVVWQ